MRSIGSQWSRDTLNYKRWMVVAVIVATIVLGAWAYLVVSYDSPLGTDNVIVIEASTSTSNESNDVLATLSFQDGAEDLDWASTLIELNIDDEIYTCSFGSQSIAAAGDSKVNSRLSSDGVTFSTTIDATSEDEFTHLSIPMQQEGNESTFTLRASKTDIFLSDDVQWMYLSGKTFQEVKSVNQSEMSNETSDRLEWYTYDLAAHRITPNEGTYVLLQDDVYYKVQFLSYYNDKDESRHISILSSALTPEEHPALQDSTLVIPSPCLIETSGNSTVWNATETILLYEQDVDICGAECKITFNITYEMVDVKTENTT